MAAGLVVGIALSVSNGDYFSAIETAFMVFVWILAYPALVAWAVYKYPHDLADIATSVIGLGESIWGDIPRDGIHGTMERISNWPGGEGILLILLVIVGFILAIPVVYAAFPFLVWWAVPHLSRRLAPPLDILQRHVDYLVEETPSVAEEI